MAYHVISCVVLASRVNPLKTARIKPNRERCASCILTKFQSTVSGLRVYMCVHCVFAWLISFRNHVWYTAASLNLNIKWLINWWTRWNGIHLHKIIEPRESIYISPTHLWHIWISFIITKCVLPIHISSCFQTHLWGSISDVLCIVFQRKFRSKKEVEWKQKRWQQIRNNTKWHILSSVHINCLKPSGPALIKSLLA